MMFGLRALASRVGGREAAVAPRFAAAAGVAARPRAAAAAVAAAEPSLRWFSSTPVALAKKKQAHMPRYLARCAADLPANPAGVLGTFAVTIPTGTTAIAGDAFRDCAGLAQVTLPATVTVIEAGPAGEIVGAFSGCSSLSEIALPPNLTEIGGHALRGCTSLSEIALPPNLTGLAIGE